MFRTSFAIAVLLTVPLAGCADQAVEDDLAGELADEGEAGGKADGVDTFTFFQIERDYRRCVSPLCGGYWVSRVNREATVCADGSRADRCYVAELAAPFSEQDRATAESLMGTQTVLVRGEIADNVFADWGNLGRFEATELWLPGSAAGVADGVLVQIEQLGIRCIASPCEDKMERKLNSTRWAQIAELDFEASGATEAELEVAYRGLAGENGPTGLIVAGDRYQVRGPGGRAKARTVNQFWTRAEGTPAAGECVVTGCSGTVCAEQDSGIVTTCEWRDEYACYDTAMCERQADGACGWTQTEELSSCLAGPAAE